MVPFTFRRIIGALICLAAITAVLFAWLWIFDLCLLAFNVDIFPTWVRGVGMLSMFVGGCFVICNGMYDLLIKRQSQVARESAELVHGENPVHQRLD
jgi:hypothetical protein